MNSKCAIRMLAVCGALLICERAIATTYPYYYYTVEQKNISNDAYPGHLISWNITEHKVRSATSGTVSSGYQTSCVSTVYRDGVAITNTTSRSIYDFGIRAGTIHEYYIVANTPKVAVSNTLNFRCKWNYWATLSKEQITFDAISGEDSVNISGLMETSNKSSDGNYYVTTSNVSWDAISKASWITVAKSGNTLAVSTAANKTGSKRIGIVKITIQGYDVRDITVTQEASEDYIDVETDSGTTTIPKAWFAEICPSMVDASGGDYGVVALAEAANGRTVWECYVAGLDPMDATSRFKADIKMCDGLPIIEWEPNLNTNGNIRSYNIYGMTNLTDKTWHSPTNESSRFFKVEVKMP